MVRIEALRDDQWARIESALPGKKNDPGRTGSDNRRFIEAVMWVGRNAYSPTR
jgi:putative transposase